MLWPKTKTTKQQITKHNKKGATRTPHKTLGEWLYRKDVQLMDFVSVFFFQNTIKNIHFL